MPAGLGARAGVFTGACATPLVGERPFEASIQHEFAAVAMVVALAATAAVAFLVLLRRHRPRRRDISRAAPIPQVPRALGTAVVHKSLRPALLFLVICAAASLFLIAIGPTASALTIALPAFLGLFYGLHRLSARAEHRGR